MIRFESVDLAYASPGGPVPAVSGLTFRIAPGERLAVLGANGSGKSTLALLANGILLPDRGRVTVAGMDTADEALRYEVRSRVQVVFQNPDNQIVATSVAEDTAFGPENLGLAPAEIRRRVSAALEAVGLTGLEQREPHQLSGGQKQRLAIAGALAMQPDCLILDEPTAMLDPVGREDVRGILAVLHAQGRAIVHITHDVSEAASANRAIVLDAGTLAFDGPVASLLSDVDRLERWGLSLPPVGRLAERLRGGGITIAPQTMRAETLAGALWD